MSHLPINTRLQGGPFQIGKVLGQGGFGITYNGGDMRLRRYVAIKEFFPAGCVRQDNTVQASGALAAAEFDTAKTKFLDEARVLAQFYHPGIVQVHTFFEENNTAYMVMEYLRGKTLAQIVEERGALPEQEAVGYIEKVGAALEEVHRVKLLHRDIKPENIMVGDDGRVVLIDFGLTKKVEEAVDLGTRRLINTTRFGSDGYAPPEQYLKSVVPGTYSDVYAVGATLYFLLTGEVPISAPERMYGVDLARVGTLKPQTSRNVDNAVMWAMQVKDNQRPQTLRDFLEALQLTTQSASALSTAPVLAPATPSLVPLVPVPTPKLQWGKCLVCGGHNPHTFRQCQCGAMLPWAKQQPQAPVISQIARGIVCAGNAEGLIKAVEQAKSGSTIRLLPATYSLKHLSGSLS